MFFKILSQNDVVLNIRALLYKKQWPSQNDIVSTLGRPKWHCFDSLNKKNLHAKMTSPWYRQTKMTSLWILQERMGQGSISMPSMEEEDEAKEEKEEKEEGWRGCTQYKERLGGALCLREKCAPLRLCCTFSKGHCPLLQRGAYRIAWSLGTP